MEQTQDTQNNQSLPFGKAKNWRHTTSTGNQQCKSHKEESVIKLPDTHTGAEGIILIKL